jgi:hypothetical protein
MEGRVVAAKFLMKASICTPCSRTAPSISVRLLTR